MAKTSEFHSLRDDLLKDRRLYNDPAFQAIPKSIYFSKPTTGISWRRPTDICPNPKYIVDGVTRFDLDQGSLGNCWYIAAAATLATRKDLFYKVIPKDQGFGDDYAGVFRFHFWRDGKWIQVIIDDKLPTKNGHLIFCKNSEEPEEFWSALLEKAYAKLHGSYEALEGGWTDDALVDFTGGIGQRINLLKERGSLPSQFFDILMRCQVKKSLMGCSTNATQDTMESRLPNGLVIGHAYSITKLLKTQINSRKESLIRLRNPWGQTEWKGRWSDGSPEWHSVEPATRKDLGLVYDDGEFWMSFDDWVQSFEQLQICHLSPDAIINEPQEWQEVLFEGQWIEGVSAGGRGNHPYAIKSMEKVLICDVYAVGMHHHGPRQLSVGAQYFLVTDPGNAHDRNAVTVTDEGGRVLAYLRWEDALHISKIFQKKSPLSKVILKPKEDAEVWNIRTGPQQKCTVEFKTTPAKA